MPHDNKTSLDRLVESRLQSARRRQASVREGLQKIDTIIAATASLGIRTPQKDQATRMMLQLADEKYSEAMSADDPLEALAAYAGAEAYRNAGILINEKIE